MNFWLTRLILASASHLVSVKYMSGEWHWPMDFWLTKLVLASASHLVSVKYSAR